MNRWIFALRALRWPLLLPCKSAARLRTAGAENLLCHDDGSGYARLPVKGLVALMAVLAVAVLFAQLAQAQTGRRFPVQAQRAKLLVTQAPEILLDGKPARLAPGARIRGSNDLLVLSSALTGQTLVVNVLLEPGGLVKEVWILSPEEAAQAPAQARN